MNFSKEFSKLLKDAIIEEKSTGDIIIKSKDREDSKNKIYKWLKSNKVQFKDTFKPSKSSSINVFEIQKIGDIIFKPISRRGMGGLSFEKEIEIDLINYWNGVEKSKLHHYDVINEMEKVISISPKNKHKIVSEGSKNQKRVLTFDGNNINVTNSTGKTLTDITITDSANKNKYLSLKMSNSFYILSAAIGKYFANPSTQVNLCKYLGMDGYKMGGFGSEYICKTPPEIDYTKVKTNIQEFMKEVYANDVVIIHKKRLNDVKVTKISKGGSANIRLNPINEKSYIYPEPGIRKYAAIKLTATIDGSTYKIDFQFRGTTASDIGPKYLRILLERL